MHEKAIAILSNEPFLKQLLKKAKNKTNTKKHVNWS